MPSIYRTQPEFFKKILGYHGVPVINDGRKEQFKIDGYSDYNHLVDINRCFSSQPSGDIVDRTGRVAMPFKMYVQRPWANGQHSTLDKFFENRVNELTANHAKLNLFWSGGIDSTAMMVGFLRYCKDLSQVRVMYSTYSMKENPGFFLILESHPEIELVEFAGDVYLEQNYDGMFVTADGADDLTASLDRSFYDEVGYKGLDRPWQELFSQHNNDSKFLEFCEQWFKGSELPIQTVLQARWWFYAMCKIQKWSPQTGSVLKDWQPLPLAFFDCDEFESYMYHNMKLSIDNRHYISYKKFLKDYIFEFDGNTGYQRNKEKVNSGQLFLYMRKRVILRNKQYIMLLNDGTRIRTQHLPFLSEIEYRREHGDTLNYLFLAES